MTAAALYTTAIAPAWIDYNGHLRDAYYSLIFSLASDALMDRLGMDEAYRARTGNTLFTLETHLHFLHEVRKTDTVAVTIRILGVDRKRIHAAFDMFCERYTDPVASIEMMLLHVHQGEKPGAQPFPQNIADALANLAATLSNDASGAASPLEATRSVPGSRRMELRSRS